MTSTPASNSSPSSPESASSTVPNSSPDDTAPEIQINGDNPAVIQVGTTYSDLGATITGPEQDLNLGIQTYLNGSAMSPIQIDTSAAATDTIDYVVTDQTGLISTSTRTVIIEAPTTAPIDAASSTPTTNDDASTTTVATSTPS